MREVKALSRRNKFMSQFFVVTLVLTNCVSFIKSAEASSDDEHTVFSGSTFAEIRMERLEDNNLDSLCLAQRAGLSRIVSLPNRVESNPKSGSGFWWGTVIRPLLIIGGSAALIYKVYTFLTGTGTPPAPKDIISGLQAAGSKGKEETVLKIVKNVAKGVHFLSQPVPAPPTPFEWLLKKILKKK